MLKDYLDKVMAWFGQLNFTALGWELVVLVLAFVGALLVHRTLGRFLLESSSMIASYDIRRITLRCLQRILFPLSMLLGAVVGKAVLLHFSQNVLLLKLAVPLLLSLAGIRLAVYVLRKTLRPGPAVKAWENGISTII